MSNKKRSTSEQPEVMPSLNTICTCDALARMQRVHNGPELFQPITYERAAELADIIAPDDDDAVIHAFIELLHGIFEAAWHHKDPEGLVMVATYRAYSRTVHHARLLVEHRRRQMEERLKTGPDYQAHDLVFATREGTPVMQCNLLRWHFKLIAKRAGLPDSFRLYDLRHTCATLLLTANEHPKVVSERG